MSKPEIPSAWRGVHELQEEVAKRRVDSARGRAEEEVLDEAIELAAKGQNSGDVLQRVRNREKKHLRRQARTLRDGNIEIVCPHPAPAHLAASRMLLHLARDLLQRQEITLFEDLACGRALADIARDLKCPSGTLKARVSRARARLRLTVAFAA